MQKLWRRISGWPIMRLFTPGGRDLLDPEISDQGRPLDATDPTSTDEFRRTKLLPMMGWVRPS